MKLKIIFLLSLSFLLLCCEKESDYRDKMTGTYSFKIRYGFVPYYRDSFKNYTGYVKKSENFANKVIVQWGVKIEKQDVTALTVDEYGGLSFPDRDRNTDFDLESFIRNDSIKFFITNGGLGAWMYWDVVGLKTK